MAPEMLTMASWVLPWRPQMIEFTVSGSSLAIGDAAARPRTRTGRGRSARCDASPLSAGPYSADIAMQPSPREPTVGPPAPSVLWITWSPSRCLPAAVRGVCPRYRLFSQLAPPNVPLGADSRDHMLVARGLRQQARSGRCEQETQQARDERVGPAVSTGDAMDLTLTDEEASV